VPARMSRPQFLEEWIDGAIICRESSAVGFVWSLYEGCLNFFVKLVPLVSERRSTASANKILNEEVGRLLSWGDGFDNGELDRTLERDPELKSATLEYLSSLGTLKPRCWEGRLLVFQRKSPRRSGSQCLGRGNIAVSFKSLRF